MSGNIPGNDSWTWDGTLNDGITPAPRDLYTYRISVLDNTPVINDDTTRSTMLELLQATDKQNNPITEAEYAGIDNNNTPNDDTDDKYMYYVKSYKLKDSTNTNASECEILE